MIEVKKRKTFFSAPGFRYGADGLQVISSTKDLLKELFKVYLNKGYNPREISYLMTNAVTEVELEEILCMKPEDDKEASNACT